MLIYDRYVKIAGGAFALAFVHGAALGGEIAPDMRQEVISTCASDAYRLCPQSLTSVGEAAACMRRKHAELTVTCRTTFDRAVRVLALK